MRVTADGERKEQLEGYGRRKQVRPELTRSVTGEDFDRSVLSDGERGTHARSARTTCAFAASLWSTKIQQLAKTSDFLGRLGRMLGNAPPMQSPESCGNGPKIRRRARRKVGGRRKRQCEVRMIFSVLERVPSWSRAFGSEVQSS